MRGRILARPFLLRSPDKETNMPDVETISERIEQTAIEGIQRVQIAGQSVDQISISELLKAEEHTKANAASQRPGFGIRIQKIMPHYD